MKEKESLSLDAGKLKFIEKIGLYYEAYGIPRIGGKIIALLLVAGNPVSAEEMAGLLKVSRSSVSTNIRLLLQSGLAEVAPGQDSRTDYFIIAENAWENAIKARVVGFMNLKAIVEQGISALGEEACAKEKLQEMNAWVDVMIEGDENIARQWAKRKR